MCVLKNNTPSEIAGVAIQMSFMGLALNSSNSGPALTTKISPCSLGKYNFPSAATPEAEKLAEKLKNDPAVAAEAALAANKIKQITISKTLKATASLKNGNVKNALDGDKTTRWDTAAAQVGGEWFTLDLGFESTVTGITLDAAGSQRDYPRGYEVYVSFDGGNWGKPITTGKGTNPLTKINFPQPVRARFVKIVQTGAAPGLFWSIHELAIHFQ